MNAWRYDITPVFDALTAREINWAGLVTDIGAEPNARALAAVKHAVYGLSYCASDKGTVWHLTGVNPVEKVYRPTGITRDQAAAFLDLPMIAPLRQAMDTARQAVERDGGARDAFGDWIDLAFVRSVLEQRGDTKTDATRSVVALVAQSYEGLLMKPVVEMAEAEAQKQAPAFQIGVWLWDGCYIKARRLSDVATCSTKLKKAVDAHAERLGIPTFLEIG